MESKWWAIAVAVWIGSLCAGMAVDAYGKNQCKISYAQSDRSAEDIATICGK